MSSRLLLVGGGVLALLVLMFAFSSTRPVPVAEAQPIPATVSLDMVMCDGAGGGNPTPFCDNSAATTSGDGDGLIEVGENPEVQITMWADLDWTDASDESFYDLASVAWETGAEGSDQTGDGFNDPVSGLAVNSPSNLGAAVARMDFKIQSNLETSLLLQNNVDDVVGNVDPTVMGQPPTCNSADPDRIALVDTYEMWVATTSFSPTVSGKDTDGNGCIESQEDSVTGACALDNPPRGVTMHPEATADLVVTIGLPLSWYMGRAFGIATLPIPPGPAPIYYTYLDINLLVYNLLEEDDPAYLHITTVGYPALAADVPGPGDEFGQTVATCLPYYAGTRNFGVTVDPDFNGDGDNTDGPEVGLGGEPAYVITGAGGPYGLGLQESRYEDYDGDGVASTYDRCDTDDTCATAADDPDGDWLCGTCDSNGEGNGCAELGQTPSKTIPWQPCQDADGDNRINQNDNCPNVPNATHEDADGDTVGDACDAEPDIPGDGTGYTGGLSDGDNWCFDQFSIGQMEPGAEAGAPGPGSIGSEAKACWGPAYQVGATVQPYANPPLYAHDLDPYLDSNDDGIPDYEDFSVGGESLVYDVDSNADRDGHTDGCEGFSGTDALNPSDGPGAPASACDCDGGGRADEDEEADGTDPFTAGDDIADTDEDGDGCVNLYERHCAAAPRPGASGAFDPAKWYDFYDVPVPANPDPTPSGGVSGAVTMGDVLATLSYVGTSVGGAPNPNGVDYDSLKDGDWFDSTNQIIGSDGTTDSDDAVGRRYDRSPSSLPDPPADAGPPNGAVTMGDVLAILAQVGLSCA